MQFRQLRPEKKPVEVFMVHRAQMLFMMADVFGALWLLWVDNQGVLHALLKGRAGADDLNNAVGQVWLDMAEAGIALHVLRVESLANVADGKALLVIRERLYRDRAGASPLRAPRRRPSNWARRRERRSEHSSKDGKRHARAECKRSDG